MSATTENKLHKKVSAFKKWAKANHPEITEENDNGEWCFCNEFYEMFSEALHFVEENPAEKATAQVIDDLLYIIARDNECPQMIEETAKKPEWFSLLCRHSLKTNYTNAKWQFAQYLPDYQIKDNLQDFIYEFLTVGDEYTERLALQSLADIYPEEAEKYAIDFYNREKYENDEYQKIMALHVLSQIRSPQLSAYLNLAEQSNYKYLKQNAQEIRARQ